MKEDNKRWLLSMLKTSGSKRSYVINGTYAEERNSGNHMDLENLPHRERIKSTRDFYNGKINFDLLLRFLGTQVGKDWDEVYAEIISRIPSKLLEYKDRIHWFVADKVEITGGKLRNKRSNRFLWTPDQCEYSFSLEIKKFYVDPESNLLVRIADKPKSKK